MHIKLLEGLEEWPLGSGSGTSSQNHTADWPTQATAVSSPVREGENEQAAVGPVGSENLSPKMFSEDNTLPLLLLHFWHPHSWKLDLGCCYRKCVSPTTFATSEFQTLHECILLAQPKFSTGVLAYWGT